MRWQFIDPKNQVEAAERDTIAAQIMRWWSDFQNKTNAITSHISRKAKWDLPGWMIKNLEAIHPNLMWEFGPALHGAGHRLVITPESNHHLRPLVRAIIDRAPHLVDWEFYEYRLPESLEMCRMTVESRTDCDIGDCQVQVRLGEHQRIDLTYYMPATMDITDACARNAAFVATESLLGEESLDKWIGAIDVERMPVERGLTSLFGVRRSNPKNMIGLGRLHDTVGAVIESTRDQLPADPYYEWTDQAEWTLWELQPEPSDDYFEQRDLFVGKSSSPRIWNASHNDALFCSQRFSRCNETFCYIKIDGSQGLNEDRFANKLKVENAIDAALRPNRLGCHIGGGTGLRYLYIDLALTDLDNGIKAVRDCLQSLRMPQRSWIQFFDHDLAAEWVGIYDDSPPPPMKWNSR